MIHQSERTRDIVEQKKNQRHEKQRRHIKRKNVINREESQERENDRSYWLEKCNFGLVLVEYIKLHSNIALPLSTSKSNRLLLAVVVMLGTRVVDVGIVVTLVADRRESFTGETMLSLCDGEDDPQRFQTVTAVDMSAAEELAYRGCGHFLFTAASHMRARAMTEGVAVWCSQYRSGPNLEKIYPVRFSYGLSSVSKGIWELKTKVMNG
ncbi:hypothetical protein YC2023_058667 [Brassica napus]